MNMAVKEKPENVSDEIEWTVDTEVQLFYAMHGHKPVGVNKYFQMVCILEKFKNSVSNKDGITSKVIWDHLDTMYDLQALDDTENLPFPNEESEFSLPPNEFATLIEEKKKNLDVPISDGIKKEIVVKKEPVDKKEIGNKDIKNTPIKKEIKDTPKEIRKEPKEIKKEPKEIKKEPKEIKKEPKEIKKEPKEIKEPKKVITKEVKEVRRESKDGKESKEVKKDVKRESKDIPKDKKEVSENQEQKASKQRVSVKEKRDTKKDEDYEDLSLAVLTARKERLKEVSETKNEDSPKRGGKRSTRGSVKPDDAGSNKSASPVTTATPPPMKRRRT